METSTAELIRLRLALGWSQYRLASVAGLPRQTVAHVERGGKASLETLVRIAKALDAPLASFAPLAADLLEGVRLR